jgi:type I restriction enzyme M protein
MSTENNRTYLEQAIEDGHAEFTSEGKNERIRYIAANHSERWSDPEEKIRAEFWAELIYKYEYDPKRIKFEVKVPRRTPNDLADLVIYNDDEGKDPYFVFELKRSDISDAEFTQAIEQACGNRANLDAPFCGSIAGLTRRLLRFDDRKKYPPGERERNHLTDIPIRYGKPPEWRFYKNKTGQDLSAVPREELRSAIRKCHQTLWEGGRRSPIAAFGEFCKIVFVKYRDEKNQDRLDGEPYAFQRRTEESSDALAKRILKLYATEQEREPGVFTDQINVDPPVLAQVVEHLEALSLDRTELDTKGVAFEEFMGGFFKGDFGQYFTPRELIAFAVEVLNPQYKQLVIDPACGSGGFLLYALDHVRKQADRRYPKYKTDASQGIEHFKYWHDFAQHHLFGIEINEELARVAKMNMIRPLAK